MHFRADTRMFIARPPVTDRCFQRPLFEILILMAYSNMRANGSVKFIQLLSVRFSHTTCGVLGYADTFENFLSV